jgi:citrate lyase subunit beta/citryl-CoA lyase
MLTALYVPGDRPDRFDKAALSGADVVIVDLEDAVVPAHKAMARMAVRDWAATSPVPVDVRINAVGSVWFEDDIAALPTGSGVRVPKVESADQVHKVAARVDVPVHCLIETALGVEHAYEIATAHPRVASIGLGEADLASDLGVMDDAGLAFARSRIVVAARAAGLRPPMMSVYPNISDLDGLASSCRVGRGLGFVGRAAIHPRQLPVIVEAFRPTAAEIADAEATLAAVAAGARTGDGVVVLPDGRMLDAAMIGSAQRVLDRVPGDGTPTHGS